MSNDKFKNAILIILAVCLIGITVAYATLSQNLDISGVAKVGKTSWNIHFTKVLTPKAEGYAEGGKATLNSDSTVLTVSEGILKVPGDTITYVFDVINEGDLDAEVETVLTTIDSCKASDDTIDVTMYCDKIKYDLVYQDTKEAVKKNDKLLKGESKTLNLIITYDKNKELTSLPNTEIVLSNITSTINYTMLAKEKSDTPVTPEKKVICKRASVLHTGDTRTFGNLGTSGTLTSGDAFDCDVNGDGTYDPETERFYYVSDYYNASTKAFNNSIAVLIYYNNVSAGSPSNNTTYAYDSSNENWHGPRTVIKQLPTTSQWNNVNLKSSLRAILNENDGNTTIGGTLPSNFSYAGYAARFLTIDEVRVAINNNNIPDWILGELDKYIYLLENTKFSSDNNLVLSWWLENARSDSSEDAYYVHSHTRSVSNKPVSNSSDRSVRPAIEVSKKNIEY